MTSYAIIGTGAVGGFYGARLQRAGCDVHFLLRSDYAQVSEQGLRIRSVDGDFDLPQVNAYASVADMPPCDVVVIALKTTHNHLLAELLPPLIHDNTVVLSLQNGLGVEADVAAVAPKTEILGGLCFLCANKTAAGEICHLDYGAIHLGTYRDSYQPGGVTPVMERLAADFSAAGISISMVDDLGQARWRKLLWNIPFNGLSVVLNATTEAMMADADICALAQVLMTEVCGAAKNRGKALDDSAIEAMLDATAKMKPYKTSMKLDYDAQRPLEIEAIFARPLQTPVAMPRVETLYAQLKFLDARNLRRRNGKFDNKASTVT
jgi:2-dehydropantoate 2-reductase